MWIPFQRGDPLHIICIDPKVEDCEVLPDPRGRDRFTNGNVPELNMPAQDQLRRSLSVFFRERLERRILQGFSQCQGPPGFRDDPVRVVVSAQSTLLKARMELYLVHRRYVR